MFFDGVPTIQEVHDVLRSTSDEHKHVRVHRERRAKVMKLFGAQIELGVYVAPNKHKICGGATTTVSIVLRVISGAKADHIPVSRAWDREGTERLELLFMSVTERRA